MLKNITRITWKKDPEQGEPGATIRPRKFEIGLEYLSGAPGEKFLDYAYYNGVWYRCRETHTPTGDRNPFYDIGHGYTTWSADSGFDFLSTKCLIVGDDGEGWTLENGQIRHTSGKITLDSNGSANFNNKTLIESDGRITAKDGCFYGSFATPPQELTNSTGAVTLSFSSGFNFTGKLTAGSTKTIYLPTDVKYNGVECTIINYGTPSNGRYLIRTSDSSKLLYTSKYDSIDDVSYLELFGCARVVLQAILIDSAIRWFVINYGDFSFNYSSKILTNKIARPVLKCIGAYTITSGTTLSTQLCADGNTLTMEKLADGQWKLSFSKARLNSNYMIVNAENTTAGIVTAINLTTTSFNIVCGAFFELANSWYYYNPGKLKFFILEYDL